MQEQTSLKSVNQPFATYTLLIDGFVSPVSFVHSGKRSFIVDQIGYIYIFDWDLAIISKQVIVEKGVGIRYDNRIIPILIDISKRIAPFNESSKEKGLLQMILHPSKNLFYLYYTINPPTGADYDCVAILDEWFFDTEGVQPIRQIIEWPHPGPNHFGSPIGFGLDGLLYFGTGDGGGVGDKHGPIGNGLNVNSPWGKILRINVNPSEPIIQILAIGFRNPWRGSFTFDGSIIVGDVGQDNYEGIHIVKGYENHGWRAFENGHIYDQELANILEEKNYPVIGPVLWHNRSLGRAIIGGYQINQEGDYIFGDYIGGELGDNVYLVKNGSLMIQPQPNDRFKLLTSFSRDPEGKLYGMFKTDSGNGGIYRINL
ncbi:hypothetical protein BH23THE1_BH23THE1_34900 [soil metagenome]